MKYRRITIITDHALSELIASAMFEAGAEGVDVSDRQDFIDLIKSEVIWDYVDESVSNAADEVRVSAAIPADDDGFYGVLLERLAELKALGGVSFGEILSEYIDDADWENEWKKYYKPIKTAKITIVPGWISYKPGNDEKVMRLDPGMAFGTGAHATTRMCLDMMDASGKDVIDVGCGSGILGIAAALTGASSVYMCDVDPQAVEFAERNAKLNGVSAVIEQADLIHGDRRADLIFANLTADILSRLAEGLKDHLNENGTVIVSGIIDTRSDEVEKRFIEAGFLIKERAAQDDWRTFKLVYGGK